ncbi:hypothetical protein [Phyllobacterium chamaecytisi]|uniref:hypothetical protein n=1 Tax=Phyllobacterium chamaecytisi TaxID=2876082 RepID=UPI001CCB76E0|nr:hypothetical protein [Phyllobacterium sp. KW56]MBZ9605297.1 hypothetical protein [Phyllobacterium sp. KW56]
MVRGLKTFYYTSDDWKVMQGALLKASGKLQRNRDHQDTDRLARRVMTLFDRGLRDVEVIASAAAYQEALVARIATVSGKHHG